MSQVLSEVQSLLGSDIHLDEQKLEEVVTELEGMLSAEGIVTWLQNSKPTLEGRIPLDILADGDESGEVLNAARSLTHGDYV